MLNNRSTASNSGNCDKRNDDSRCARSSIIIVIIILIALTILYSAYTYLNKPPTGGDILLDPDEPPGDPDGEESIGEGEGTGGEDPEDPPPGEPDPEDPY